MGTKLQTDTKKDIVKKERLTARDLISLGIFNAIAIVGYMVIASVACMSVIGMFISTAVAFLIVGVVYMLMAVKIKKRGVFIISGVLMAIISITGGHIYHAVGSLIGGILAEIIVGRYERRSRLVCGYAAFALMDYIGIFLPAFVLGADYLASRGTKYGMTAEALSAYMPYVTTPMFLLLAAVNIICAVLGAYIGMKLLKKHFVKAGLL